MAIIRDAKGNVYNIPDDDLENYLVHSVAVPSAEVSEDGKPLRLCLDPQIDAVGGPHDGWGYTFLKARPDNKA